MTHSFEVSSAGDGAWIVTLKEDFEAVTDGACHAAACEGVFKALYDLLRKEFVGLELTAAVKSAITARIANTLQSLWPEHSFIVRSA